MEVGGFIPGQILEIQHEAVPALIQRLTNPLRDTFGVPQGERTFETHPYLLLPMLQIDLDGKTLGCRLATELLP